LGSNDGGDGGEVVVGGRDGGAFHAVGGADEEDLAGGVCDSELVGDGDGRVNAAAVPPSKMMKMMKVKKMMMKMMMKLRFRDQFFFKF